MSNGEKNVTALPEPGRFNPRKALITLIKLGLGVLAVYLIIQKVDLDQVGIYMGQASWIFLLLSCLAFFVSKVIAARRINKYFHTQGLVLSEPLCLKLSLLSMFYSLFIPLVGGEGYRIYWLRKRYRTPVRSLVWSSLLDRASGMAILLSLVFVFLQFTSFDFTWKRHMLLAIILVMGAYFLVHRWFFRSYHDAWPGVTRYAIAVQAFQVITAWMIMLALGMTDQVADYLFIFLLASMAYVLPFIGAREMAFVFGAEAMGLDPELSLAISLFFYLSLALTSVSGIVFMWFPALLGERQGRQVS